MLLEDSFEVLASPEQAWELLNDVPRVIPCMPGAELTEVVGENEWKATVRVKLGPIGMRFLADVRRESVDEGAKRVVLAAVGREASGRGGAQATIESKLTEMDGKTEVAIVTDLALQGVVAQYGRGIVADVSAELTKQFAECLAATLASDATADAGAAPGTTPRAAVPQPVQSIPTFRLAMKALWRSIRRLFSRMGR